MEIKYLKDMSDLKSRTGKDAVLFYEAKHRCKALG